MDYTVLFLCTGNYYRSRFAEIYFNTLAPGYGLEACAVSRGIAIELGAGNIGPISPFTVTGLQERHIAVDSRIRYPRQVQDSDFMNARLVIAMDEREHRPMMRQRFPGWTDLIQYWQVADIADLDPQIAVPALDADVHALLDRLKKGKITEY